MLAQMTDRERAQRAEAALAEALAELEEYRRQEKESFAPVARPKIDDLRIFRANTKLKSVRADVSPAASKMLLALIDAPGQIHDHFVLAALVAFDPEREPDAKIATVYACKLRSALKKADLPGVIENVWGQGYTVTAANAVRVKTWLGETV